MKTNFSPRISLLATIPFVLFGFNWSFSIGGTGVSPFSNAFFIASVVSMFILLGIGWVKDFPRWSLPAVGFCTLFSAFFTAVTVPGFKDENLGYWAWVPLLITLVICLIIKPSISPAKQLAKQIKNEPILIGFILYGFAPFFIFLFCDEIHSVWMLPIVLVSTFILSLGLYLFLKSERRRMRFLSIVYSGLLAFIITFTASYFYWEFLFKY